MPTENTFCHQRFPTVLKTCLCRALPRFLYYARRYSPSECLWCVCMCLHVNAWLHIIMSSSTLNNKHHSRDRWNEFALMETVWWEDWHQSVNMNLQPAACRRCLLSDRQHAYDTIGSDILPICCSLLLMAELCQYGNSPHPVLENRSSLKCIITMSQGRNIATDTGLNTPLYLCQMGKSAPSCCSREKTSTGY